MVERRGAVEGRGVVEARGVVEGRDQWSCVVDGSGGALFLLHHLVQLRQALDPRVSESWFRWITIIADSSIL